MAIDIGGFVVPGDGSSAFQRPRIEEYSHAQRPTGSREEAGPAARSRQGPSAEAAASGEAAHAVGTLKSAGVDDWELEGLAEYYPDLRVVASTSSFVVARIAVGLFAAMDIQASIYFEIPRSPWDGPTCPWRVKTGPYEFDYEHGPPVTFARVPPIRSYARWLGGPAHGMPVVSHHEYPDGSMCACMPFDWIRGRDRLLDYAAFCTLWVAKALHDRELDSYPGPQHTQPWVRVQRSLQEFCGCGKQARYADCCWEEDHRLTPAELEEMRASVHAGYFAALRQQRRARYPLRAVPAFRGSAT